MASNQNKNSNKKDFKDLAQIQDSISMIKVHKNKINNYQEMLTKKQNLNKNIKKAAKLESYQINHGKIQSICARKVSLQNSYIEIMFF